MATTLSNITLSNNEYIVSSSNPTGLMTINQATTQNYLFSYNVNILPSRIHNYITSIGDVTSNLTVTLNGSNLSISNATSNLFNNFIPSAYLTTGYNSVFINRIENKLIVGVNGSNIVRIANSNVLPQTYNNSTVTITASNNTKFNNISLSPTAITNVAMNFTQPIKATSITCSNVSSCNIDVLSNTSYWSSNSLVKRTGDTISGLYKITGCNGVVTIGSTGQSNNQGSFISFLQADNMINRDSNQPYYGVGVNGLGVMTINSYYGINFGDVNNKTMSIWNNCLGIGLSNPAYKLDVNGVVNATSYVGSTISALSNLGLFGSNTALWSSNASLWSSNASVSLCNNVTSFSNSFIGLSNNFSTLSNSYTSFSNSQISFSTSTNSSISFLSNAQLTATSNFNTLSNFTYSNVYGLTTTSNLSALSNYTYSNVSSLSNAVLITTSNISSLSNFTYSNVSSLSNYALTTTSNLTSLSNYTYGINGSNTSNYNYLSNTTISLSNNVSAIASSLSNTSNSLVAFSNYEEGRLNSLSNFAYNINTSNSTVTNVYTSNIYSSSGGTIGSLIMSAAGLSLSGYNLLNNSGFLTSALKDATGLKINVDPSSGSMSALSLLGKLGQFEDSLQIGLSTIVMSNNAIYFKNSNTSNTVYTSNAITVLNSALTNFTISNANIVTNCNLVSPTITSLSNIAYYASNNLLSKSGGTINGSLYVSACNGGVYLGVTSNQGSFVSLNQGVTMMNSDSNFPAYGIGCSSTGKVNLQGYFGLSFGDNINTTMTISGGNVGIGLSNPSTKLDVSGTINASAFSGSTITNLSNMGLFSSNASVYGSNTVISLSNQVFGSTTTSITNAQTTANFGSNTSVYSSNSVVGLSNYTYGTIATNISTAQTTATYSSNASVFGSNTSVFGSNCSVSASNTAIWSSNNLLNKSGGTVNNYLQMSACNGVCIISSSSNGGSYISLAQGANMFSVSSNQPYYGMGVSDLGFMGIHSYGGIGMGDLGNTQLYIRNNCVGVGVSNPSTYKLDVSGTANVTGNITSPTITSLSNLGMYSSNTSGYSSNTTVSLSNYIYTTSTTNISAVQSTATYASNASVFSSNLSVVTSNSLIALSNNYNNNITNAQSTASFGSNASVWSSNNLLSKSGDTMVGSLLLQSGAILSNSTALSSKTNTGAIQALVSLDGGNSVRYSGGSNTGTVYLNPDLNCTTQINYNNSNNTTIWYGGSPVLTQSLGNVGIGMTSPSYKLDVSGTIRATTYILPTAGWITSADNKNRIYYATNDRTYYGSVNGHEWRSSNDTNIMNLTDGGSLAVLSSATLGNALLSNVNSSNCGMVHSALGGNTHSNYAIKQDSAGLTTINCAQNQYIEFRYNNTPQCYMTSNLFNVGQTLNASTITSTYQTTYSSAITNLTASSVTVGGGTTINHMKLYPISIGSSGSVLVTYTLSGTFPSNSSVFMTFYNQGVNDLFSYTIKSKSTSSIVIVIERTNGGTWATNLQADILVVGV